MLIERKVIIERKEKQVSLFYRPIHLNLTMGGRLWHRLVKELEEDSSKFRQLMPENMTKARASVAGEPLVKRILEINAETKTILQTNPGMALAADDLDVYAQFLAHAGMLELAHSGQLHAPIDYFEVFPREFPALMRQGLDTLKADLGKLGQPVYS